MQSVGYDLYCKMLAEAVQEAKGIAPAEAFETTIDLNVSAYIPDSYISNESLKLDTYKRIAAIENKEEYEDMTEELTDRFGEPPKNVQNLLAVAELKALAHCAYVTELKQMGDDPRRAGIGQVYQNRAEAHGQQQARLHLFGDGKVDEQCTNAPHHHHLPSQVSKIGKQTCECVQKVHSFLASYCAPVR